MWAFGTSPYGLALEPEVLWSLSPREYDALKEQWQKSRDEQRQMYAEVQATLHNAWLRGKDQPAFIAVDFLGGRPPQTAEEKAAVFSSLLEARKRDRASVGVVYSDNGQGIPFVEAPPSMQLSREEALAKVDQWRRNRLDAVGVPLNGGKGKVTLNG